MRIWDIHPGYLNRQSLLGEHRELHGVVSIYINNKKGYSRHPETLRWAGFGHALEIRHRQLSCEMALRGFTDRSPVFMEEGKGLWPETYIDAPARQFELLRDKYISKEPGRIPLPRNVQQVWSHHKYSVLARDHNLYKKTGPEIAGGNCDFNRLSQLLTETLRTAPLSGGIKNALQHMWGHVSDCGDHPPEDINTWSSKKLLGEIQKLAVMVNEPYLITSTALSDLMVWL